MEVLSAGRADSEGYPLRIQVSTESLRQLAARLQQEAELLDAAGRRLAEKMASLDLQVRGAADVELSWRIAQKRRAALIEELERITRTVQWAANAFESADRYCLRDYTRITTRLRSLPDLWADGDAETPVPGHVSADPDHGSSETR